MAKVKIVAWKLECERCGKIWKPRKELKDIRICPYCKSPYWDRPRKKKVKK